MSAYRGTRIAIAAAVALVAIATLAGPSLFAGGTASGEMPPQAPLLNAPPLFAVSGQSRTVTATVTGRPDTVTLAVRQPDGTAVAVPMHLVNAESWTGDIPGSSVTQGQLSYSVGADYSGTRTESDTARLVVLRTLATSTPEPSAGRGKTIMTLKLGTGPGEVAVAGGSQGATILPSGFSVDFKRNRIFVLDTAGARVLVADAHGRVIESRKLATGSRTASDIVTDPDTGDAVVLDQTRDAIVDVAHGKQKVWTSVGLNRQPSGARMSFDGRTKNLYLRDSGQGGYVPVLTNGRRTAQAERSARARRGQPTALGDLAVEVDGTNVTFGLSGSDQVGYSVAFSDPVLDVAEAVVDGRGIVWGLVGTLHDDAAAVYLVRLDPHSGTSRLTHVGASVPGDVTRRLAPSSAGVVLMEGAGQTLSLVRYDTL